jgi:hypothetical protein
MPALLTHCMFDVSLRTKLSVSVLAQRKIESARPRKHGLFLRTEEKMRLYGRTLASFSSRFFTSVSTRTVNVVEDIESPK